MEQNRNTVTVNKYSYIVSMRQMPLVDPNIHLYGNSGKIIQATAEQWLYYQGHLRYGWSRIKLVPCKYDNEITEMSVWYSLLFHIKNKYYEKVALPIMIENN